MPERFVPKAESDTSQPVPGMTWEQVWTDTQAFALAWSIVTLVWGLGVVTLVWWRRGQKLILWPEQRFYLVPWGAFQVVVLMLVGIVLSSLCTQAISWPKQWALWRFALVGVVEAVLFVWAPIRLLGIPAYQLGWNWRRWPADVALAWLIWLLASPVTMAVWMAAVWFWPAEQHTLIEELRATPSWLNALALAITAIVLAPLAEEGLFRGLIQRKMAAEPLWADLTMLIALCAAIVKGYRGTSWGPILFLVTAGPGYLAF
ncbi:MAG: CPBP family glutamic-type intramembrane protease, partial [Gemmatales bacterium]|nr:CPBP family glutamic-type intramembrane protease [Gemmatales bacterium]MDW8176758.1 CPBP family glutamic-type intramembrane protease [Gemmatales bacterium]